MLVACYLRRGTVYIPTSGMIERGFYRGIEPVAVVAASNTDALRQAFAEAIARGNPKVPAMKRHEYPPPVLLKYAALKKWNTFARDAFTWDIEERNGIFSITYYRKDPPGGSTKERDETFPPGAKSADAIERMISILQEADRSSS